jgi:PAS domain S-box-containing protein
MSQNDVAAAVADRRQSRAAMVAGLALLALGLLVIIGWRAHLTVLLQVVSGRVPMQYNTAIGFLGTGGALVALARGRKRAAFALGAAVFLLTGLTLIQMVTGADLGIDRLFFQPYSVVPDDQPGRMSPVTAVSFVVCGLVLMLAGRPRAHRLLLALAASATCAVGLSAVVALGGSFMHAEVAFGWELQLRVAVHTALGLLLLSAVLLYRMSDELIRVGVRFRRWLALIAAGELLLMLVVNSVISFHELGDALAWARRSNEALREIQTLRDNMLEFQRAMMRYAGGDRAGLEAYTNGVATVPAHLAELARLTADDPAQSRRTEATRAAFDTLLGHNRRWLELRRTGDTNGAIRLMQTGASRAAWDNAVSVLAEFATQERSRLDRREATIQRQFLDTLRLFCFGAGLAGLLLVGAFVRATREADGRHRAQLELHRLNEELEERVKQRTAALDTANRDLRRADEEVLRANAELEQRVARRTAELEAALTQLNAQKEQLRHTFDHAPIGMSLVSLEGRWLRVNPALCEIVGLSEAELLATDFQTITHPDDLEADLTQLRQCLAGEISSYHLEKRYFHRDGQLVHVLLNVSLVRDDHGRPLHFVSQIQDITARKEWLAELNRVTERLQLATAAAGVGIWDLDVRRNVLIWDEQMHLLYGVPADRFGGALEAWERQLHPEDLPRARRELEQALRGQSVLNTTFRVIWPDGTVRHIRALAAVHRDAGGQALRMLGTNWDITEQVQAQESLRRSESFIRQVVDLNTVLIFVQDREGRFVLCNRAAAEFYGTTVERMIGRRDADFGADAETLARLQLEDREVLETKLDKFIPEEMYPNARGEFRWLQTVKRAILSPAGEATHLLVMATDITARKLVEQESRRAQEAALATNLELAETNAQLERAIARANEMAFAAEAAARAKADFLATMSHEIRTPMNGVIGMTSLLLDTPLSPEQTRFVETVRSSGESLLVIINDILDFSKIESGKMTLEISSFDLRACVEQSLDLFTAKAAEKRLRLSWTVAAEVPRMLLGDVTRLRQVLVNLVGNAVKFTDAGEVSVTVAAEPGAAGTQWHFAVRDTGIGIPRDKLHLLFQSFQQIDSSTTRRFGGTGLGLAISRRLCELMGGRLWVESEPGRGSVFHFTVSARSAGWQPGLVATPGPVAAAPVPASLAAERPLSILMAEDNSVNQLVAQKMIERLGYRADTVADGQEAVRAFGQRHYDVILMDLEMPNLNGYDAARQIRLNERPGRSPWIVALTAHAVDGIREDCVIAGMNDYLAKPIKLEQLEQILRRVPRPDPLRRLLSDAGGAAPQGASPASDDRRFDF